MLTQIFGMLYCSIVARSNLAYIYERSFRCFGNGSFIDSSVTVERPTCIDVIIIPLGFCIFQRTFLT